MPVAADSLHAVLDRLADYESETASVVSVYLDLKPEQPAQTFKAFLQAAMKEHEDTAQDLEKILAFIDSEKPSSQALALFVSSSEPALFESVPLEAPLGAHRLYIDREPHVFPLERLADQYQSYAALLVNTNAARLYLFSAGAAERQIVVKNKKGKRVSAGGWSQARYQRRVENLHVKHMKEVAEAVDRLVREENIARILVGGDEVALPLLREQLAPATLQLLTEVGGVDIKTAEDDLFRVTLERIPGSRSAERSRARRRGAECLPLRRVGNSRAGGRAGGARTRAGGSSARPGNAIQRASPMRRPRTRMQRVPGRCAASSTKRRSRNLSRWRGARMLRSRSSRMRACWCRRVTSARCSDTGYKGYSHLACLNLT